MSEVNSKPISDAFPACDSVVPRPPIKKQFISIKKFHLNFKTIKTYFIAMTPSSLEFCS